MLLKLNQYRIRMYFFAVFSALLFLFFNISVFAQEYADVEFYSHVFGYFVSVPEKYVGGVSNNNENMLRIIFDNGDDEKEFLNNITLTLRAENYYSKLPEDQRAFIVDKELSLGHSFFNDTYNSHSYMVTYFNNAIRGLPGYRKDVLTIEHNTLNGKVFWVCHYHIYNANNILVGEGKVLFTVYNGFTYNINTFNREGMLSEYPEVENTMLSIRVGRRVGDYAKYIWTAVGVVIFMFFSSILWIITRPRKLSPRQEWKKEYKMEKRAIRKGLPIPTFTSSQPALIETSPIPLLESPDVVRKRIFRANLNELNLAAEYADRKKLLFVLDMLLGRYEFIYDDVYEDYEFNIDSNTQSEVSEDSKLTEELKTEMLVAENATEELILDSSVDTEKLEADYIPLVTMELTEDLNVERQVASEEEIAILKELDIILGRIENESLKDDISEQKADTVDSVSQSDIEQQRQQTDQNEAGSTADVGKILRTLDHILNRISDETEMNENDELLGVENEKSDDILNTVSSGHETEDNIDVSPEQDEIFDALDDILGRTVHIE